MKEKIGCGKEIEIMWNFGNKIIVKCGFQEEGFMPNLCEDCEKRKQKIEGKK